MLRQKLLQMTNGGEEIAWGDTVRSVRNTLDHVSLGILICHKWQRSFLWVLESLCTTMCNLVQLKLHSITSILFAVCLTVFKIHGMAETLDDADDAKLPV